jgi:hypothetical protein
MGAPCLQIQTAFNSTLNARSLYQTVLKEGLETGK